MKLLTLDQAKIDGGESNPKAIKLGQFAVNIEDIVMIHELLDKYDVGIKNVVRIVLRNGETMFCYDSLTTLMDKLNTYDFST